TERKRAEEQFRLVVESSPSGMLMVDENGTILLVNRQIERLFGYERAELIGQPVERLVPQRMQSHHAGDRAEFFAHSESRAMGKGRDLYGLRKDGQEFSLEIGLNPIRTLGGMRVLASVVDISERKRAEQTLQKERDFIDAVLETAGALVVVLDRDGRILRFNRACEQTTGYSSEEVMGRFVWDLFVLPDEVDGVKALFKRLRGGEPRNDYENYWRKGWVPETNFLVEYGADGFQRHGRLCRGSRSGHHRFQTDPGTAPQDGADCGARHTRLRHGARDRYADERDPRARGISTPTHN
ncbi:MAG: PAS domain S-box protein, partial [Nitrospiraceae bacterium]